MTQETHTEISQESVQTHPLESAETSHHSTEFFIVFLMIAVLVLGAVTRQVSKKLKVPYTIGLLLTNISLGFGLKYLSGFGIDLFPEGFLNISPHLIIFVFLPALIFESAYNMDAHKFRKALGTTVILAGPILILSTLLTAFFMVQLTHNSWQWGWPAALVFGALISATDPVAVVAILSELGVSKRLSTLIEGESLLNDGTAIVVFSVLLEGLRQSHQSLNWGDTLLQFAWVVGGGILVGFVLVFIVSQWLGKIFNDPEVEITLTIALAYLAMLIAEGLLHVSGVMAIVCAGLWMSQNGKTKISPEITSFLHRFWEMLAYIANTLIFSLVGLIMSQLLWLAKPHDFLLILLAYIGIVLIRFLMTFASRPLLALVGGGITPQEAFISVWGGLRGAVSLALALMVAQNQDIPAQLRHEILLITVGVVLLSILINGSSINFFLGQLGFKKKSLPDQLSDLGVQEKIITQTLHQIQDMTQSPDLKAVNWTELYESTEKERERLKQSVSQLKEQSQDVGLRELETGYWQQMLDIERQAYWGIFQKGLLSSQTLLALSHDIDLQKDQLPRQSPSAKQAGPSQGRYKRSKKHLKYWSVLKKRWQFSTFYKRYERAYGLSSASRSVLQHLKEMNLPEEIREQIQICYQTQLTESKAYQEEMREYLPELILGAETRMAERMVLNGERELYYKMMRKGIVSKYNGQLALSRIELDMKTRSQFKLSERMTPLKQLQALSLFGALSTDQLALLLKQAHEEILDAQEYLFKERESGQSLYLILRGVVEVLKDIDGSEEQVNVLSSGDIIGEMAFLSHEIRSASVRTLTTTTFLKLSHSSLNQLGDEANSLLEKIWGAFAWHHFDNILRRDPEFDSLESSQRFEWFNSGQSVELIQGQSIERPADAQFLFLVHGDFVTSGKKVVSPCLWSCQNSDVYHRGKEARVIYLPALPE